MIKCLPIGSTAVEVHHSELPEVWEFGCAFRRGKGRLFNTYTRYYLRPRGTSCDQNVWEGWPSGAPDPMDPSEQRRVFDWIEQAPTRQRHWLQRKIEQHSTSN